MKPRHLDAVFMIIRESTRLVRGVSRPPRSTQANVLGSGVMVISLIYYYAGAQLFEGESC